MKDNNAELAKQWLKKARNDLLASNALLNIKTIPFDIVCYHNQQSIEKSLKALLTFSNQEFKRTHDLIYLLNLCHEFTNDFNEYLEDLSLLTSYAVEGRYPGDSTEPEESDTLKSNKIAQIIFDKISALISADRTLFE
ncbi:MAG: HEPN domain-containing protein [Bacteroidota bacterium]|jgi:HEPN domain-containing protein